MDVFSYYVVVKVHFEDGATIGLWVLGQNIQRCFLYNENVR